MERSVLERGTPHTGEMFVNQPTNQPTDTRVVWDETPCAFHHAWFGMKHLVPFTKQTLCSPQVQQVGGPQPALAGPRLATAPGQFLFARGGPIHLPSERITLEPVLGEWLPHSKRKG